MFSFSRRFLSCEGITPLALGFTKCHISLNDSAGMTGCEGQNQMTNGTLNFYTESFRAYFSQFSMRMSHIYKWHREETNMSDGKKVMTRIINRSLEEIR